MQGTTALMFAGALAVYLAAIAWLPAGTASSTGASSDDLDAAASQQLLHDTQASLAAERWQDALSHVDRLLRTYPNNPNYQWYAAQAYRGLGDFEREAAAWESFVSLAPRPIDACPDIGIAYRRQGRAAAALDAFERCLDFDPLNADSIFYLANALENGGDVERAEALYREGLLLAPDYHDIMLGLARIAMGRGELDEATRIAEQVVAEVPDNADGVLLLAVARRAAGDLDAAKRLLDRALALNDQYVDVHIVLGGIAEQEGRIDDAIDHYQRAIDIAPSDPRAARRLAQLRRDDR